MKTALLITLSVAIIAMRMCHDARVELDDTINDYNKFKLVTITTPKCIPFNPVVDAPLGRYKFTMDVEKVDRTHYLFNNESMVRE